MSASASTPTAERLHALDAVRGFALLLGIAFHATLSFLPGPHQLWPMQDIHRSAALAVTFFSLHVFRMTTFFLIAGFFAHLTFHKRGARAFIRDRLKRIGIPLVAGWPFLFAGIVGASLWAAMLANGGVLPKGPPPGPPAPPLAFPLTHLWFLYVLLIFYAATLAGRWLVGRLDERGRLAALADKLTAGLMANPLGPVALAAPLAVAVAFNRPGLMWFGIPTPDSSLIPNLPAFVGFGFAFLFGWVLHRQAGLIRKLEGRWAFNLGFAALLIGGCLSWLGVTPVVTPAADNWQTLAYGGAYALATWCGAFGLIGMALRYLSNESPARRYVADASYWLYLIHMPIIMALQVAVSRLDWPAEVKFAAILAIALPLMFASYELMVRHSFIGAVLNGRRVPRPARLPNPSVARTHTEGPKELAR
jgi:peptidoglycan/LPS O-acetylase OafA/YrhL